MLISTIHAYMYMYGDRATRAILRKLYGQSADAMFLESTIICTLYFNGL